MAHSNTSPHTDTVTLFLCGDVMTGRGIDQVLPSPSLPQIYESYASSAGDYVTLAESRNGPIAKPVAFSYLWGEALEALERQAPDARIINLETAITQSETYWKGKGIHYRMHPNNLPCITAARIDCCVLANNHVLDWGYPGLQETLESLNKAGIQSCGAGQNLREAQAPAIIEVAGKGRVLVFSFGMQSSGIEPEWGAGSEKAGVNMLHDLSEGSVRLIAGQIQAVKQARDIAIVSLHWGGNWGYAIPREQRTFTHRLIDEAGVDVFYGHSSHHPKGIEIYREKPILYGCGDLLNDYEGISGYETYRDDLGLMYFPTLCPSSGTMVSFELVPTLIRNFRLNRPAQHDIHWLMAMLNREGVPFGTHVEVNDRNNLTLYWK